ncbi:hypothetical protein OHA40_01035 [Nocardia sp. NBC_00508]|uniref:hypothetical protein n=1 Tax=Nocardia sp. NBC_00508 TaxID=2975992 RepID=UPI002E804BB8|nr:hypothetical protein [Nocardia sp. NBC_00508]WUD66788.1 hypothetical protein OHA40_01035 [Nocardia sp. NBC_00508]
MNPVLTEASVITCGHPVTPALPIRVKGTMRLTVSGFGVLTGKSIVNVPVPEDSCVLVDGNPAGTEKCTHATATGGVVALLTVDGEMVLGQRGFDGTTTGVPENPEAGLIVSPEQTILTAG